MFKKLKNVGKKEVTLNTEPNNNNKSSLEPSNEKDPRDKLKKDKSKSSGGGRSVDGSERSKERKKDRDGKGESFVFLLGVAICLLAGMMFGYVWIVMVAQLITHTSCAFQFPSL
jgi:hypothetical protein